MWRLIVVLMIVGLCVHTASALPGSGTQQDPYRIESLADFDEFAADPNYWSGFTRLETDVNLAGRTYTTAVIAPDVNNSDWWFDGTAFTGVFDGNAHKITNLTIDDAGAGNDYLGLFGFIYGGEVKNLGLEGGSVSGDDYVGGLVGENWGTLSNCYSTGDVSGGNWVGGLVGENYLGSVSNCYSTGDVNGTGWSVGGLVGDNYGNISKCYSTGDVSGSWDYVGGLVGSNGGIVSNCYSTDSVNSDGVAGGLVGENWGSVSNCYSTGSVTGSDYVGGLIGAGGCAINSFWDIETSGQTASAGGTGKTTTEMKLASTFFGWNGCGEIIWTIDEGNDYPRLLWEDRAGQPLPEHQLRDFVQGSGTETDPYMISTAEQLNLIGLFPCELDKCFILANDINLIDYKGTSYNIIGSGTPFSGVFDGNDHKIVNLTIDGGAGNDFLGLFGYIGENGEVKNLGLEGGSVSGDWYVGGMVGWNVGNISNCYTTGYVNGDYCIGGLVGLNRYGSVSNCYSTGNVSGDGRVGGLVGLNEAGSVSNCYSAGDVNGNASVGGLVGDNWGNITNCYSTGDVNGVQSVGGLVGCNGYLKPREWSSPGYIFNSYSTGDVNGIDDVGGLVGYNLYGDIERSFWDVQTSGEPNMCGGQGNATGCDPNCGKTTAEMKTKSTFTDAGWDFVEIWGIGEHQTYPYLRFAPAGDFNYDKKVDLEDLAILASHWLEEN